MIALFLTMAQGRFGDVDPGFLRDWLIVLAALGGLAFLVLQFVKEARAKKAAPVMLTPDPLRMEKVRELATREELRTGLGGLEKDIETLREEIQDNRNQTHGEVVKLHERINVVASHTDAMRGRLDEIAASLRLLVERVMRN